MNSSMQILKKLTAFSISLILSGLLQQLFNWVDAIIVGNFIGETALAGVGATTSIYNLFVTVIVGFTSGLSVLFAQQFGKGKQSANAELLAVYTVLLTIAFAVISFLGWLFVAPVLNLMDTPTLLFDYQKIICKSSLSVFHFWHCTTHIQLHFVEWETAWFPLLRY